MPRIKIETTQNVVLQAELASLGDRVVAALIDYAILTLYLVLCYNISESFDGSSYQERRENQMIFLIVSQIPAVMYFPLLEYYANGKSLGKMALKIQTVPMDGGKLTIGQVFVRSVFRIVDAWGINILLLLLGAKVQGILSIVPISIVGILFIAFTRKEQRLGDMSAGTVVVKLRKRASLKDTVYHFVEESYKPVYTNVLMLSDYDIRAIKEAIMLAERYNNYKYAKELAIQVKKHLKITEKVPATGFLKTILKDYNYLANNAA